MDTTDVNKEVKPETQVDKIDGSTDKEMPVDDEVIENLQPEKATTREDMAEKMASDSASEAASEARDSMSSNGSAFERNAELEQPTVVTVAEKDHDEELPAVPRVETPTQRTDDTPTPAHDADDAPTPTHAADSTPTPTDSAATSRPSTPKAEPVSPLTPNEADAFPRRDDTRESMASIALSESSLDYDHLTAQQVEAALATPKVRNSRHIRKPSSLEILQGDAWPRPELERHSTLFDSSTDEPWKTPISDKDQDEEIEKGLDQDSGSLKANDKRPPRFSSLITTPVLDNSNSDSGGSSPVEVDWQQLDANEREEKQDKDLPEGAEDESTAFLLARLEQENAKITAANTHSKKTSISHQRLRSTSRPPSMGQLRRLVQDKPRYSLSMTTEQLPEEPVPEPPPMTELEFWAALVQDYPSTASRLPTLTTSKIRSGIPPPLRGVVWTSMSGARDRSLEDAFERLQHEKSPYDGQINKDVGRSFPGVELFRDAEGEGQKMLGRVLKCFSLHDKDIGYCQGLGFLVGPLLMNMGEREAFCVLVRLMDHYSLRPSFLPSLSGLHMRIFQFSSLLRQHHSQLASHLEELGIEPAYLSQWFLSCFAVTCPLSMLFRIYDVIFAEGANETVMRVALALMRRNESKMLQATEFEEVMQLLLGRGIWDVYGMSADELVDDFTSLGGIITHARLSELEAEFERGQGTEVVGERAGFLPDVQAAASRFLGRLWAPSGHTPTKSTSTLSPHTAEEKAPSVVGRASFLRRSASKQSISTLNESDSSSGAASLASTAATDTEAHDSAARESQATDAYSFKSKPDSLRTVSMSTGHNIPGPSKEERDPHGQIEDLLTALSEMQREQQSLAAMLQREREERGEDQRAVKQLVQRLRRETPDEGAEEGGVSLQDKRKTLPPPAKVPDEAAAEVKERPKSFLVDRSRSSEKDELESLVERVDERLQRNNRMSASFETKSQLRDRLARTKESLATSEASCRDLTARLEVAESSLDAFTSESDDLRAEVKELRIRVNEEFKARQKLEHTIRELRAEARTIERKGRERVQRAESASEVPTLGNRRSTIVGGESTGKRGSVSSAPVSVVAGGGLKELKLGRRDSSSSVQSLRSSRSQKTEKSTPPAIQVHSRDSMAQHDALPSVVSTPAEEEEDSSSPRQFQTPGDNAETPTSATGSMAPALSSPKLEVPNQAAGRGGGAGGSPWHARTSSLATKEVFSTPQHEVVPDEALLLELVNAKTSEAQAHAELDELRRSLNVANRRHEAMMLQLRAEMEAAKAAAEVARLDASRSAEESQKAKDAMETAKAEATMHALNAPGTSVPTTPAAYDSDNASLGGSLAATPAEEVKSKKASESRSPSTGGGWFWGRRAASQTPKAVVTPPAD